MYDKLDAEIFDALREALRLLKEVEPCEHPHGKEVRALCDKLDIWLGEPK